MLHVGSNYADGIECPGVLLWRFMIAGPERGKGYGREALGLMIEHLRALRIPELHTSYAVGGGSPEGFYRQLGFVPTGGAYGDEIEVVYRLGGDERALA